MKKIINAIRDFIYNITDYGLIISVVVIMVAVLAWRFDILFNINIEKEAIASVPNSSQVEPEVPANSGQSGDNQGGVAENPVEAPSEPAGGGQSDIIATIEIPQGTFPSKIGDILENSNLIENKNEFLNRSIEMGLDTKLQSGTFDIAVGTSLDEVIKIIAKAN